MRELEFLPRWYNDLRRQKRLVRLEMWVTVLVAAGLAGWLTLANGNIGAAQSTLGVIQTELKQTEIQLKERDRLTELERQLAQQQEVQSRLGQHVEAARLIGTLGQLIPMNMSLLNLNVETEEIPQPLSGLQRAALKDPSNPPMDRRLKVRVGGVAPTDVDLATFITELNRVPFFDRVAMTYARDRKQQGHVMREFELTFSVNLAAGN